MKILDLALDKLVQYVIIKPCKDTGLGPQDRAVLPVLCRANCSFWTRLISAANLQFGSWFKYLCSTAVNSTVLV